MEDLAARAVQMARARHPGRPEVAREVSLRIQAGDVPAHVIAAAMGYDFSAGLTVADMLAGPEVRKDMSLAAFIDSVAQTLPAVAPAAAPYVDSELIEREFYLLDALAARWRCTPNDIVHLGMMDAAQVCANIYGMATGIIRTRMDTSAPEYSPDDEPQTDEEQREAEAHNAAFERWKSRTTRDMPHGLFELMREDLRFLEMPNAFPYELHEALKFDGGWWEYEFDPPVTIGAGHLCVLRAEVARLDAEVFSGALGGRTGAQTAAPDDEPAKVTARQDQELKRIELVKRHSACWQTIERDLKDASTNELQKAAWTGRRGWWREGAALDWARARGKLIDSAALPSSVFDMGRKKG